jgi:transposase
MEMKPYLVKSLLAVRRAGRPPKQDFHAAVNGMLYVLKTGCQWRMLPKDFPSWQTVYSYLRRWRLDQWNVSNRCCRHASLIRWVAITRGCRTGTA